MANHCTLSDWTTNSITVHATSHSLFGPFHFQSIVQPAWSHNPLVSRDPMSGEILIAHIGCGKIAAGMVPKNCSEPSKQGRLDAPIPLHGGPCECPHYGSKHPPHVSCQTLQILESSSPEGPFEDVTVSWPLLNTSQWPSALSNPTILLPENPSQKVTLIGAFS
jgi:hypothetical protein